MTWNMILKKDEELSDKQYIDKAMQDIRNGIKMSMMPGWQKSGDSLEMLEKAVYEILKDVVEHILQGTPESLYHDYKYKTVKK